MKGYDYVVTPSPMPGVDASPLMTWGHVEGTPLILDSSLDLTSSSTFKIKPPKARERIGHMLDKEASEKRGKGSSHAQRNQVGMSPAAMNLARKLSKSAASPFGGGLQGATIFSRGSSGSLRSVTPVRGGVGSAHATSRSSRNVPSVNTNIPSSDITGGLL